MKDDSDLSKTSEQLAESRKKENLTLEQITSIANDPEVFRRYKQKFPETLHSLLLYSLSHEIIEENEAQSLWEKILSHWYSLNTTLGRDVGISVAALDYMSNMREILTEPVLIEEEKSKTISKIATNDKLTGLVTRSVFDFVLDKALRETERTGEHVSLSMIDIDDFKHINDTYGHQQGDRVLARIGEVIQNHIRARDTAARYGGEELTILMPDTPIESAKNVVDRIRSAIQDLDCNGVTVTVSIGLAQSDSRVTTSKLLIEAADTALYKAKSLGKNQVVTAQ